MPVSLLLSSWVLVLLAIGGTTAQPLPSSCDDFSSHIELSAEAHVHEVCISLAQATTFHFDAPLEPGGVKLQGGDRFVDLLTGASGVTLLPPKDLRPGERLELVVRFPDGAAPTSVTFVLVGHPAMGARQVDVFRHARAVEDYQRENQEEREKAQRCGQDLEQLRVASGPGGLTGLLASRMMGKDGIASRNITNDVSGLVSGFLAAQEVISYRASKPHDEGKQAWVRVAVSLTLGNPGSEPWMVKSAALVGRGQQVKPVSVVWQGAPVPPGEVSGQVVVELELTEQESRGPFKLKLWDETGTRLVTLGNVTFP